MFVGRVRTTWRSEVLCSSSVNCVVLVTVRLGGLGGARQIDKFTRPDTDRTHPEEMGNQMKTKTKMRDEMAGKTKEVKDRGTVISRKLDLVDALDRQTVLCQ